jgi:hypothetical protein
LAAALDIDSDVGAGSNLDALYREALVPSPRSPGELHLLRLLQRMGPCWAALSRPTAHALLERFVRYIQARALRPDCWHGHADGFLSRQKRAHYQITSGCA